MREKLLTSLPEVFVSTAETTVLVSRSVKAGQLRKLASRLYTRNLTAVPDQLVRAHLWSIVAGYFPGALIADRTALENRPAADGSICLITPKGQVVELPGITLRPRRGAAPLESDSPFVNGLFICSTARAYLENMRVSRSRGDSLPATLGKAALEERLDTLLRLSGEGEINRLRDAVRGLGGTLNLRGEAAAFDEQVGALLGTREVELATAVGRARHAGKPYDPARAELLHHLFATLRATPPVSRPSPVRSTEADATLAFFESYFSNFIEGTEFLVSEAADIVFRAVVPADRPADAHDVLGTWRLVSSLHEMGQIPGSVEDLLRLLQHRHGALMKERPELRPGKFKLRGNQAGSTTFVAPDLVLGTLKVGFEIYQGLEVPLHRAIFMMFLVSEVHPFSDGNGRVARIMMNAELVSAGEGRIIIPTVYRGNYLAALKAISQADRPEALIRTLDYAQKWSAAINWGGLAETQRQLEDCHSFLDASVAEDSGRRLRLP